MPWFFCSIRLGHGPAARDYLSPAGLNETVIVAVGYTPRALRKRKIRRRVATDRIAEQRCVACVEGDSGGPERDHRERSRLLHLAGITGEPPVRKEALLELGAGSFSVPKRKFTTPASAISRRAGKAAPYRPYRSRT